MWDEGQLARIPKTSARRLYDHGGKLKVRTGSLKPKREKAWRGRRKDSFVTGSEIGSGHPLQGLGSTLHREGALGTSNYRKD